MLCSISTQDLNDKRHSLDPARYAGLFFSVCLKESEGTREKVSLLDFA